MTEKLQLRDAVYRLEDTIREIRNRYADDRGRVDEIAFEESKLTHCSHWQCRWLNRLPREHRYPGWFRAIAESW